MSDDGARYVGRTVGNGRFQLQSLLGEGGMASVYLAYDSVLDRQVAVKTLHTELGREASFRERFRREAQSVAKLTHTNIVSVFDSGEDEIDGVLVPYIVMEYVEGKPLRTVLDEDIAQYGAMPAEKALQITADVLAALDVSHELGLVHRDIKPGNVMVTKRGVVKVMDFGIARAMQSGVTSMTQTGMVVGTPQYLSPEQALGRGVDARSDLYSVGIMLFELLTGQLPFNADSPLAIAYAHVQEEAVPPSSVNQSLPPAVDALVARTLRKNPNERFPSAQTMRDECERIRTSGVSGGAPAIVGTGPAASGAGLGQAVFPPVGEAGTPPAPGQHFPGQYPGGYGPSTPPPTGPMAQPGFNTPAPYGPQTPAPYTANQPPAGPPAGRGGKNNNAVIIGSAVAAIAAIVVVIIAVNLINGGDDPDPQGGGGTTPTPTENVTEQPGTADGGRSPDDEPSGGDDGDKKGFTPEDTSRKIEVRKCTEATDSYSDDGKKIMPELTYNNLSSVKECIRKAGWKLGDVTYEDENVWGKNMVLDQSPDQYDSLDPEDDKIDLTVSTGQPAN